MTRKNTNPIPLEFFLNPNLPNFYSVLGHVIIDEHPLDNGRHNVPVVVLGYKEDDSMGVRISYFDYDGKYCGECLLKSILGLTS